MSRFNLPEFDTGRIPSVVDALSWWAANDRREAFTFLTHGEAAGSTLSFQQLHQRACSIANALKASFAPGARLLLFYEPGLHFIEAFWGCLYAGMVAVPSACPDSVGLMRRVLPRLQSIHGDCQPHGVLTSTKGGELIGQLAQVGSALTSLPCIVTEEIPSEADPRQPHVDIDSRSLALLQYTSGSTGTPRGVMVSHGSLVANQRMIHEVMHSTAGAKDVSVGWLPFHHDMGLVGNLVQSVYRGAHGVLMAPMDFVRKPVRWLKAISDYRANISGGPNFAYELCLQRIGEEQARSLDLSCWRTAFCGAEPVRHATLQRFTDRFGAVGFRRKAWAPVYGLAEATLLVSGVRRSADASLSLGFCEDSLQQHRVVRADGEGRRLIVSCGAPPACADVRIVDVDACREAPPDKVGEIWVSAPSVCDGYWNLPEPSEREFRAHLPGENKVFLRTGDLGFMHDGELFIAGRLKDLIIIRGRNHHPSDIESTAESCHPNISAGRVAAFSVESDGAECLTVVAEISKAGDVDPGEITSAIQDAVTSAHQVAPDCVMLARPGAIPRTSSGKIQRSACRRLLASAQIEVLFMFRRSDFSLLGNRAQLLPTPVSPSP